MKKIILVLISAISMTSFASNAVTTTNNATAQKAVLGQHVLLATTVNSAKNSAVVTNRVALIAKSVTANIG